MKLLAELTRTEEALELNLSPLRGAEFGDALEKVKQIPGSRFDWDRKLWLLPPDDPAAAERCIYAIQPEVDPAITEWLSSIKDERDQELVSQLPEDADGLLIPWAHARAPWQPEVVNDDPFVGLKPHQRAVVDAVAGRGLKTDDKGQPFVRAIIADDLGLGKSIEALSIVAEVIARLDLDPHQPKLIVCPNSVKGVWKREINRWLGHDEPAQIIDATSAERRRKQLREIIARGGWAIVNYEQLRVEKRKRTTRTGGSKTETVMKEPLYEQTKWLVVIGDEIHRAKNRKAAQTRGLWRAQAPILLGLSGTPIMNSPDEAWAPLHWLFPKEYTSFWRFFEQYVEYVEGYFGKIISGVRNPDALRFELKDRLYRRTKDQVLDLPEKVRIVVPVTLDAKQRKLYTQAETQLWVEVGQAAAEGDKNAQRLQQAAEQGQRLYLIPNAAARTVRLRQILSTPALLGSEDSSVKLDTVEEMILDNRHKQHVVFSEFVETCNIFAERLRKHDLNVEIYTGQTEEHKRTAIEDAVQRGEVDVVVGTIGAMREGITLASADTVHFIERAWVPGWNEQAEDRLHRIGQSNKVTVYIYEAENTVDDGNVKPTLKKKERIVSTVLEKDEVKEFRKK